MFFLLSSVKYLISVLLLFGSPHSEYVIHWEHYPISSHGQKEGSSPGSLKAPQCPRLEEMAHDSYYALQEDRGYHKFIFRGVSSFKYIPEILTASSSWEGKCQVSSLWFWLHLITELRQFGARTKKKSLESFRSKDKNPAIFKISWQIKQRF